MSRIGLLGDGVVYPISDDQPMAESGIHRRCMIDVADTLELWFRRHGRDDVCVGSNNFLYYERGNSRAVVAPDVYVVVGAPAGLRDTYMLGNEPKGPDFVTEELRDPTNVVSVPYLLVRSLGPCPEPVLGAAAFDAANREDARQPLQVPLHRSERDGVLGVVAFELGLQGIGADQVEMSGEACQQLQVPQRCVFRFAHGSGVRHSPPPMSRRGVPRSRKTLVRATDEP